MRIAFILVLLLAVGSGCSKPPPPNPVAVKGRVVFADGKPVKGMILTFHPDDEATKTGRLPTAVLGETGTFSFEALPGKYRVTLGVVPKAGGNPDDGPAAGQAPTGPTGPGTDPVSILLHRHASISRTPLTAEVPSDGSSDLTLTVR